MALLLLAVAAACSGSGSGPGITDPTPGAEDDGGPAPDDDGTNPGNDDPADDDPGDDPGDDDPDGMDPTDPGPALEEVSVRRDAWGVPHVFADSDAGAMFGVGYAMAQDRFFQMSWMRAMARGEAAATFGPGSNGEIVANDRWARTLGLWRHAQRAEEQLDGDAREWLVAFARGVNHWLASPEADLHPWFNSLALPVEAWRPADSILLWNRLGLAFAGDPFGEVERLREFEELVAKLGSESAALAELLPDIVYDDAAAVVQLDDLDPALVDEMHAFAAEHGVGDGGAEEEGGPTFSQVWAIGGARSVTGGALLLADPRAGVRVPSTFFEYHARGATFEVHGAAPVGTPQLLVGRTHDVGWGVTSIVMDQSDLFRIETDPGGHPGQYFVDGAWRPFELDESELIPVAGAPDAELVYRETVFGPLVTGVVADALPGEEFALRSVALETHTPFRGFPRLARATSARAFGEELEYWRFPSINAVFADGAGSIGYWAAGAVPVRAPAAPLWGRIAQDGTRTDADWVTFIPHHLLPWVLDPTGDVVFSANHMPVGSWYPLPLGIATNGVGDTPRSRRLRELLTPGVLFDAADVIGIHGDAVHPARRDLVRLGLFLRDVQGATLRPSTRSALQHLEGWLAAGATMTNAHYATACAAAIDLIFRKSSAGPLVTIYGEADNGRERFLKEQIARIEADPPLALGAQEAEYVDRTLAQGWDTVLAEVGPPESWAAAFAAQLAAPLETWTSIEGLPSLAPGSSVDPGPRICLDDGTLLSQKDQSFSLFAAPGDPVGGLSLLPPGQAQLDGPHAAEHQLDQLAPWASAGAKPSPLLPAGIEALGPVDEEVLTWDPDGPPGE